MDFLEIANSPILFGIAAIPVLWATAQAVIYLRMAIKEAKVQKLPKKTIKKVITVTSIFSIIPSLPIVITLAVLTAIMGRFIPWLRLSVMGSPAYESFAAELTLKAFGMEGSLGATQFTPEVFVAAVWVMSTAIMAIPLVTLLLIKSYDKKMKAYKEKGGFMSVATGALMVGLMCTMFIPGMVNFDNPVGILVGAVAFAFAFLFDLIAEKTGAKTLEQFSFPLAMIIGMASAVLFS